MRVLILGVTGMLGNAVFKVFNGDSQHEVFGTLRDASGCRFFSGVDRHFLLTGIDVLNQDDLVKVINQVRPEVIVNCVGLIKQLATANDPLAVLPINSLLPHRLARLAVLAGAYLIHISTDCVFSGRKGSHSETDISDAEDLYGRSKYIGELSDIPHAITLRTSIIGHELNSKNALVSWFLSQGGQVKGFSKAIYSGLPAVELARVIKDFVLPHPELNGLYHVSAKPISKLDLLRLIAKTYNKKIDIISDDTLVVDRSLNSERFTKATSYVAPDWAALVKTMYDSK
jgi:dTDP-4-dehydrorhamnose reductase